MSKGQHVVPHQGDWAVRKEGSPRVTEVFPTQEAAIERAREIAINQEAEVFIHGRNGQIRARNSYGNDPEESKG